MLEFTNIYKPAAFYIQTDLQNGQSFRERLYTAVFEQMFHSNNCYLLFRASGIRSALAGISPTTAGLGK
jgi:hypothetical protein